MDYIGRIFYNLGSLVTTFSKKNRFLIGRI